MRREAGHTLRALGIEVKGEITKHRPKRTWKKHAEEEKECRLVLSGKKHFADQSEVLALIRLSLG